MVFCRREEACRAKLCKRSVEDGSGSCLTGWHGKVNRAADDFFYSLGRQVARSPKKVITAALLGVVLCCIGFVNFRTESDSGDLWVPKESISRGHEELITSFFGEDEEWAMLLYESPDENGNVLTKHWMDIVWEVDAKVMELETGAGERYSDLCVTNLDGDDCAQPFRGITRFWGNDFEAYQATVSDDADVLAAVNVANFPDGAPVTLEAILGNSITYGDDGEVVAAEVMMQSYALSTGNEAQLDSSAEWQLELQNFFAEEAGTIREETGEGLNVLYFTSRSIDDALAESVTGEVLLFVATYVVMVVTVMLCVGRCKLGAVERRSWLGLGGVVIVVAAGLAAYGVCSGFGVPFTGLAQLLPFILVGIGVDDMFVIISSLDHTDVTLPVEERLALAMKRCGLSITYTSLTNFAAFLLGSITKLPAVEYFCGYASTSILFVFVLQVTVFPAFLAMDLNRQIAGKMDWLCCCKSKAWTEERVKRGIDLPTGSSKNAFTAHADQAREEETSFDSIARHCRGQPNAKEGAHVLANPTSSPSLTISSPVAERLGSFAIHGGVDDRGGGEIGGGGGGGGGGGQEVRHLTGVGKWMRDRYAPFILSGKGKVLVLMATGGLLVAGIFGVTKVTQGLELLDLAPDDHFARDFMETAREHELGPQSNFVGAKIFTPAVDYTNTTVQALIQATDTLMTDQTYYTGPVDSWLTAFATWAVSNPDHSENVEALYGYWVYNDPPAFYSALDDFLAQDGKRFQSDIAFDETGEIAMSFSSLFIVDLTDSNTRIGALEEGREAMAMSPLVPAPFVYSVVFLYAEQYLVIYDELNINFLLALAAVALLSFVVLGSARVVALVCLTVAMIDIELLGFVHHWGLQVNAITVIELIMAIGLVVDYIVHIVHYYLHQDPAVSKNLRIGRALGEIGPSVVVGAITTFLGVMVMAFASNAIFRVFFKMFLIIITFGFFHGVVFVPVALSLLPESSFCFSCCPSSSSASSLGPRVRI